MTAVATAPRSLAELETTIRAGLSTFVEVGTALAEVRDRGLYRESYSTFEDYCAEKWSLSRPRAYQLMEAAGVAGAMSTMVDTPPIESERQARALAPVLKDHGPEVAAEVLAAVADDGPVTAAGIKAKADEMGCGRPATKPDHQPAAVKVTTVQYVDADTGEVVPPPAPKPIRRRPLIDQIQDAAAKVTKATARLERLTQDDRFPRNAEQAASYTTGDLTRAAEALARAISRIHPTQEEG